MEQIPNPEINREEAVSRVHRLGAAMEEIRARLRDHARHSVLSNVEEYYPDEVAELRKAVRGSIGLPVHGGLASHEYFIAAEDIYRRGRIDFRARPNDFEGVVRGAGEVPVPQAGSMVMRLCLVLDPLYTLQDETLSKYYADRGRMAELRHPFAKEEFQDQRVYLPIDAMSEKGISLVAQWNPGK